ncbi:MAG: competence/damage-inducible protein A [Myxococcota bacterium]
MSATTPPHAWVLTIGDELLRGEIVDSNKAFLCERLLDLQIEVRRQVSVADDAEELGALLREAAASARVVVVSGGLGPTRDDITASVVAHSFGRPLVRDEASLEQIRRFFARFGREMTPNNAKQADFPEGAEVLPNPHGTAPGFLLETGDCCLACLPGVPGELYAMMQDQVVPRLASRVAAGSFVHSALLRTFGLGESTLDRRLDDLARGEGAIRLGFRTQFPDNCVRVVARAPTREEARRRVAEVVREIRQRLGPLVLGEGEGGLEAIVGELLREQKRTLALAESCTGGLIASRLTDVPGSSEYLLEAAVTYSNRAKIDRLGVSAPDLERHGAVSEPIARQMAAGARQRSGASLALAVTGIAGPGGGSADKPVGTLYLGLADGETTAVHHHLLAFDRARNKLLASQLALDWLRRRLLGLPEDPDSPGQPPGERGAGAAPRGRDAGE